MRALEWFFLQYRQPRSSLSVLSHCSLLSTSEASTRFVYWITTVVFSCTDCVKAYKSPLSRIPGPWFACWTTLHLKYLFARGTIPDYVEQCHKKYGDVIRLGPRQIWVADKTAMKDILLKTDLPKVTMYAEILRDRNSPGLFGEM